MDKQLIQLTEQDLHMLVEDSVKEYLIQEGLWDTLKGGAQALGQMAGRGMKKVGTNAANAASGVMDRIGTAANNAYNNARQTGSNVVNTVKAGAANANIQSAKNNAIKALKNFLEQAKRTPNVAGPQTLKAVQNCIKQLNSAGGRSAGNFTAWKNQTMGN